MGEGEGAVDRAPASMKAGERLRQAREAQGLDLAEVAARTRIPQRHLEAIETSNFSQLPSTTYAMGFGRSYARAVGLDEVALARDLRRELDVSYQRREPRPDLQPHAPPRLPSKGLANGGLIAVAVILVLLALWFGTGWLRGGDTPPAQQATAESELGVMPVPAVAAVEPTPAPATGSQVTLAATDEVWVRVYDAAGKTLMQKTMAAGERYDVPADANAPMINVGRPDKLAITINGSSVAPLGTGARPIKDIGISAQALRARDGGGTPAAAAAAATTPQG
ncbi:helix-turn-helix domain-containing protein [Sphingomonas sp. 3-13AW]|jgi:cytoskeletal protein RodZ|uniref:helix-turn-helix domain-containing protein n=1 Tax=Sphingomonas sp. 3-13AW TaxID=3050450 RepID=UPI003BB73100